MSKAEDAPWIFEVADPRGYLIHCSQECWRVHILPNHSALEGLEKEVERIIAKPDYGFIYEDRNFSSRHVYYGRDPNRRLYIKVVVEIDIEQATGEVVTAFHVLAPPAGEVLIWPQSSR